MNTLLNASSQTVTTTEATQNINENIKNGKEQASVQSTLLDLPAPSNTTASALSILDKSSATPASISKSTSISSLRIPIGFGAQMAVKKVTVHVPVGKPKKSDFFRVKGGEDGEFLAYIFEHKGVGETYLLSQDMAEIVPESVRIVRLYTATDRRGNPLLIPLPLPSEDGKYNPWHQSLAHAIERAKTKWIRVVANMPAGANDVLEAQGHLSEPEWTEHTIEQLIEIAFREKIITEESHPIIQELLGRV